jgi:ubiquinone/menaquinone biosynthesis C-methylase UbiE
MSYFAKKHYQDEKIADSYYQKRFQNFSGQINHILEKKFLHDSLRKLTINSALDVACGTGRMTKELLRLDIPVVTGVDISSEMLDNARKYCNSDRTIFLQADAVNLQFEDNSQDLVISFRFLDHLPESDKKKAILEMIRCSRKYLVFSMANKNRITQIANKIRKRFNKNYYEGFLLYESDFVEFLKDNDVKVVRRRLKFPLLSMEVMYFCEV